MGQMSNRFNLLGEFKEKILGYFVTESEKEWVDVYVTPTRRLDLTIVSDQFLNRKEASLRVAELFRPLKAFYSEGFQSFYTIDEAELLGLDKPRKCVEVNRSWESLVTHYMNEEEFTCHEKKHDSRVISFYSYKGGVGRTIALIQVAYLLAKRGKRVLLLDLDVEAPSLYDIFKDQMDAQHGLVDYLYERVMGPREDDKKLKIIDIYSKIEFTETLKGDLYVVPASGNVSAEYVFKLTQLQPRLIAKSNYINDLIVEFEETLGIDLVLIDSRTGFNEWGAFSLAEVADDIILFAYPNRENVAGMQVVLELMKKSGCKNITVAFSRVDKNGMEYAKELFAELGLEQQFISFLYNPNIAVARQYPVLEALEDYGNIADFIMEGEYRRENTEFLAIQDKKELLKKMLADLPTVIMKSPFTIDLKMLANDVWYIATNIDYIRNKIRSLFNTSFMTYRSYTRSLLVAGDEVVEPILNEVQQNISLADNNTFWLGYYLYMINNMQSDKIEKVDALKDANLLSYYEYLKDLDDSSIAEVFTRVIKSMQGIDFEKKEKKEVCLILNHTGWIDRFRQDFKKDWVVALDESISFFYKNKIESINVKVVLNTDYYEEYKEHLFRFKTNSFMYEWKIDDVKEIIREVADMVHFYFREFKIRDDLRLLALFWGTRVETGKYSKTMLEWFYEKLQRTGDVNPVRIQNVLIKAFQYELQKDTTAGSESLLTLESLVYAFEKTKE